MLDILPVSLWIFGAGANIQDNEGNQICWQLFVVVALSAVFVFPFGCSSKF